MRGCAGQVALLTCDYTAEQLSMCEPAERAADGRLPALARASECVSGCTRPSVGQSQAIPQKSWSAGGSFGAFALQWVCTRALARSTSRCHLHLGRLKVSLYACHSNAMRAHWDLSSTRTCRAHCTCPQTDTCQPCYYRALVSYCKRGSRALAMQERYTASSPSPSALLPRSAISPRRSQRLVDAISPRGRQWKPR